MYCIDLNIFENGKKEYEYDKSTALINGDVLIQAKEEIPYIFDCKFELKKT